MSWSWPSGRGDGFWRSDYSDWKAGPSRPNQKRWWMCTTCGHYNSPKAVSSQCGLRRSWAEFVKAEQQTNSVTLPSQPKEEIKALEAALAALPDNVEPFGKVRAPLEERRQYARKEARDSKPLGSTSRRMPRCPSTRFQGKTSCDCSETSSTSGIRKSRGGGVSYSSRICRARETGTFANHPANLFADHLLQRINSVQR